MEGDVDWNPVTTLTYPAVSSFAGLVAGKLQVSSSDDGFQDLTSIDLSLALW